MTGSIQLDDAIRWQREAEEKRQRDAEILAAKRKTLLEDLRVSVMLGEISSPISVDYDGYGDSGEIHGDHLPDGVADLLWETMWSIHAGFENNEGGNGTITWDLATDVITIDHNDAEIVYHNTVSEH